MNRKAGAVLLAAGICAAACGLDFTGAEKVKTHLFDALDSKCMPSEYASALHKSDYKNALRIAADYFRKRETPAFFSDLNRQKFDLEIAKNAAAGRVTVVNITHQFPDGKIDFLYNPTVSTGNYNPEWQWQLNRMYFWQDMALCYLNCHDEKIAAAFAEQVYNWVTTVPCPVPWKARGSAWRTIETGLRLMGSWQTAFEVFRKSPSVSDETLMLMLASMHEQAVHALEHRTARNWLMMELNGVHTFAVLFPEFKTSAAMRKESATIFCEELKKQILPDGMHNELSPDYHSVVFNCLVMLYRTALLENRVSDLPKDAEKMLEQLAESYVHLMTPGFTLPRTNDCFTIRTPQMMKKVCKFFPHRKDFLWCATEGRQGVAPAGLTASRFMPYAGFVAMRSSWNSDAAYLCFDVGPLGAGHMHQDKLNINIYKGSEELLFDDGGGQYEVSDFRTYGTSAYGHNTVLVDNEGQNRKTPLIADKPADAKFFSSPQFDYACGIYDDTFGKQLLKPAVHKREILFVKPDFFVVADTMNTADGNAHDYTMLLQLDTRCVRISDNAVHGVLKGKYDLYALVLSDGVSVKVESGQTSPVFGWYVGRNDETVHPASTVKITAQKKKQYRFLTLLFPLEKNGKTPEAKRICADKWQIFFNGKTSVLDLNNLPQNFK